MTAKDNIKELAEFFPNSQATAHPTKVRGCGSLLKGETIKQALARQEERTARIHTQIAAKAALKATS